MKEILILTHCILNNAAKVKQDESLLADDGPIVRSTAAGLERAIENWARATETYSGEELQEWFDHYQDDDTDSHIESRYRMAGTRQADGSIMLDGQASDFDPYPQSMIRA